MTLEEIKSAIAAGHTVHWSNPGYTVIRDSLGQYLIAWNHRGSSPAYWGLTWQDGKTINGEPEAFFVAPEVQS